MPTTYTSLLGLALPTTGELSGTWGDTVNNYITQYVDAAVEGTQTISGSQTAVTLSVTNGTSLSQVGAGATGSAQYAIINCTGNPGSLLTITVPASSREYIVINATSTNQSVKVVGAGPTTGVTMVAGERAIIAWNGSDFVKVATSVADGVTTIDFGTTGLTPSTATSGAVTVAGTLALTNGGTGSTTASGARTNLGATTVGGNLFTLTNPSAITFPRFNADNTVSALNAADFRTAIGAGTGGGTVTSVSWTGGIVSVATATTTPAFTIAGTSGGIPYFNSGTTWATSAALAANAIVIGGGAGAAPSTTTTGTGVVTAIGNAVNTTGGLVTQSGTLAASSLLLGGGSGTAITSTTTGTGVVTALGVNVGSSGAFTTNNAANTFTALQTFSGSTSVAAMTLANAKEVCTVSATAATGTIAYDVTTQSVLYYTSNASANWTVNFRGSSGTSLNTLMNTGESITVAFLVTQGATAYYNSAVQVDGSSVTPKWQGGTAPTAGNASSIDAYTYTIVKTGSAAFTVFASQTQFK